MKLKPRSIYTRFILILVVPIILLQLIAYLVFAERQERTLTKKISKFIGQEISSIINNQQTNYQIINNIPSLELKEDKYKEIAKEIAKTTKQEVKILEKNNKLFLYIAQPQGVLRVIIPKWLFEDNRNYLFISWLILASIILLTISLLFLRGQLKTIVGLRNMVINLGRNSKQAKIKPSGSKEIRQATIALIELQERMNKMVNNPKLTQNLYKLKKSVNENNIKEMQKYIAELEDIIN